MATRYESWLKKFQPKKNHLDSNAPYDGLMFETYGTEAEFVKAQPADTIWTLLDCDGKLYLCPGWHYVNRMGYFITTVVHTAKDLNRSIPA